MEAERWQVKLRAAAGVAWLVGSGYACLWGHRLTKRWRADPTDAALGILQSWSRWARWGLRLRLRVVGTLPQERVAIIANHRSYLDILAVSSRLRATYLSRGDVETWPLIGPVLHEIDSVFVDRRELSGRARAARGLLRCLRKTSVVIFPEGTTTGEALPAEFPLGLFRLLHRAQVAIIPATITYDSTRAYWVEDLSLWQHIQQRVCSGPPLVATLHLGTAIHPGDSASPEELRGRVYAAIAAPLLLPDGDPHVAGHAGADDEGSEAWIENTSSS